MSASSQASRLQAVPQDTICAVATASGGAIGMIRVSGLLAISITDAVFIPAKGKPLIQRKPYSLAFGRIMDGQEIIDEVLVAVFHAPHSYTGENSVEIMCHGGRYILQKVMELLIGKGCRIARPGEYTLRAFLNGKMDLSQAEAVADLISASSSSAHRLAMNQMRGEFVKALAGLRNKLVHFASLVELELDFSDHEDIEFVPRSQLSLLAAEITKTITDLVRSFKVGNVIKNGVPVAIVGDTNVGKSTLLNVLLHEEKAIVSDVCGTTRDAIEDIVNIGGVTFRFIDTAGIRNSNDVVENLGIERTFDKINHAEIVLWLVDASLGLGAMENLGKRILPCCQNKSLVVVFNKADLVKEIPSIPTNLGLSANVPLVAISAKYKTNIDKLEKILVNSSGVPSISENEVIVTNARHYNALTLALKAIQAVEQGIQNSLPGDLLAQDIRECVFHLSDIVGEITPDTTLQHIFENFCIGK